MKLIFYFVISLFFLTIEIASSVDFQFSSLHVKHIRDLYGNSAVQRIKLYEKLINTIINQSEFDKLIAINNFVNQIPWVSDRYAWKKEDYWASPLEFLAKDMGDCEDYVIAKYYALRRAGIDDDKLYFTYVKAKGYNKVHMVLSYYRSKRSIPLVLDNINKKILPGTHRSDLIPVYSFNAKSLFLAKQAGRGDRIPNQQDQNKRWVNFLENLEKEKL